MAMDAIAVGFFVLNSNRILVKLSEGRNETLNYYYFQFIIFRNK